MSAERSHNCTAGGEGCVHPEPPHPQHQQRTLSTDHPSAEAGGLQCLTVFLALTSSGQADCDCMLNEPRNVDMHVSSRRAEISPVRRALR